MTLPLPRLRAWMDRSLDWWQDLPGWAGMLALPFLFTLLIIALIIGKAPKDETKK